MKIQSSQGNFFKSAINVDYTWPGVKNIANACQVLFILKNTDLQEKLYNRPGSFGISGFAFSGRKFYVWQQS